MPKSQNSDGQKGKDNENLPSLVTQFLENQKQELQNDFQEIELKKSDQQNAYDYGCKALNIQQEDRKEHRSQITLFMKYGFWLIIFILILLSLFVAGCIYTNNIHIIISVLKVIAYILPSAMGGYFLGFNRGKKASNIRQLPYEEVTE